MLLRSAPGSWGRQLRLADRGTAMLEFALGLPVVLTMGGYGLEVANYALVNMRVNQIALTLADNASRIGSSTGQPGFNVKEADLNDVLQGARLMGAGIGLTTNGRITISSLENVKRAGNPTTGFSDHADDTAAVQRLHWQRCAGQRGKTVGNVPDPGYDSSYGAVPAAMTATAGTDRAYANRGVEMPSGFGPTPALNAPAGSEVIMVEINYQYRPLFGTLFMGSTARKIHYVASFVVRDQRDPTQLYNPNSSLGTTVPRATCNLYNA